MQENRKERKQTMTHNLANDGEQVLQNQPEINYPNSRVLAELVVPHLDAFNSSIVRPQNLANYF